MATSSDPGGTGEFAVERSPLRTTFVRSHSRFVLSWPDDSTLEIKYHRGVRAFAWVLCLLGWPVLLVALLGLIAQVMKPEGAGFIGVGLLLLWGGTFTLMGVWLFGPRYRFDAADDTLTVRHFWRTRRRRLSQIIAVQVVDAGWFGNQASDFDRTDVRFRSYQLNVVLDAPDEPRLFVAYNSDLTDMARKARLLADFLTVPLLAAPQVRELAQTYSVEDGQRPLAVSGARRFRGSDALRPVSDGRLPEPYRSWIDGTRPLPAQVRLLPRTVAVLYELLLFVTIGFGFVAMDILVVLMFGPVVEKGPWGPIVVVGGIVFLLALLPCYLLRRLGHTIGAWRQLQRGTLRQGILVGPEGVLVRMEPNRCYAIALDRFVTARVEASASPGSVPSDFVIETLDGPVAFFLDSSSAPPEQLNQCVAELRSGSASAPG